MRSLAFIMRGSVTVGLVLLALISPVCHEVSAAGTKRAPINGEQPTTTDDDVWLISTRQLGSPSWNDESHVDLKVSHYSGSGDWSESGLDELLDSESRQTIIYVHGNRVAADEAIRRAWATFRVFKGKLAAPPMRLIIWTWPSDEIHGQIRDIRSKAYRADSEGQYLGWFLSQMDAETRISLIGYSYGARIATGAIHVLAGGTLSGRGTPLAQASGNRRPIHVILIAGAMHSHWLAPGGYHDRFSIFAGRVLVLYNTCDPLLKRYRLIEKRGRPVALGYTGAWGLDDDLAARTEQRDVCSSVGKTHSESNFLSSTDVVQRVNKILLLHVVPEEVATSNAQR